LRLSDGPRFVGVLTVDATAFEQAEIALWLRMQFTRQLRIGAPKNELRPKRHSPIVGYLHRFQMIANTATPRPATIRTQLPIPSPAMVTVAPAASSNGMPQHAPNPTAASTARLNDDSLLSLGEGITELIEGR